MLGPGFVALRVGHRRAGLPLLECLFYAVLTCPSFALHDKVVTKCDCLTLDFWSPALGAEKTCQSQVCRYTDRKWTRTLVSWNIFVGSSWRVISQPPWQTEVPPPGFYHSADTVLVLLRTESCQPKAAHLISWRDYIQKQALCRGL